ncbi:ATP-binding protein [Jiangella gansuensis]|uniref:ATP-binding protein n=1 Tax=Jiangella gansuensis TaxID=281473 RepID=UPI0004786CC7|nr:AAA family ATPase [Jiangella gansuensis]
MAARADPQRLVGRDPALASLRAATGAVARGSGRLLLVTGEPGIGKTKLLAEAAAEATAGGAVVLPAQCWEGDGAPAYWAWVQVLRAGIAAGGDPGEAHMLLPGERVSAPSAGEPADARFRLFDAVVSFLTGLAERSPVVVVIDDLQWADPGSLRLLEFATRHLASRPVLLLGAYRDEDAGEQLRKLAGTSERVPLFGLPKHDVAALMRTMSPNEPSPSVIDDVWRRTGGNPFLVRELTRLLVAQGGYRGMERSPSALLDTVRDILERKLARLSQPCADLLTAAAVIGPEIRLEVVARFVDEPDQLNVLLDEAVTARVLAEPPTHAGPFRFSHDLFRETLVAGLAAEHRIRLHLAAGRALEALGAEGIPVHPAELAAHFYAAVTTAPADAVRYAMAAGAEARSRLAFEESCEHYQRALAALDRTADPDPAARLELVLLLADTHTLAGHSPADRDAYRQAAATARTLGDAEGIAAAALGLHALGWRQDHAEAIALLTEAVDALPGEPTALRARALAALARDLYHARAEQQDWQQARVLAEDAVATARKTGDAATLAFCLLALHDASWRAATAATRLPIVDEMLAAAQQAGDGDLRAQARLLRATALIELGDPEGLAELDAYCRHCERLRHARARYGGLTRRSTLALLAGNLSDAKDLADKALRLGLEIGEPDAYGVHETLSWAVRRATGDWHTFTEIASDPWSDIPLGEAITQITAGDIDGARVTLSRLPVDTLNYMHDLEMLAFLTEALVTAGTDEQRARLHERMTDYAGTHIVVGGCASYFGAVELYLGMLAQSLGRLDEARASFGTATDLHRKLGAPAWAQRSSELAAACRRQEWTHTCLFRRDGDTWTITFHGTEAHLPDRKGLHDLAVLLAQPGEAVHAVQLHTGRPPRGGADEVLDEQAKNAYRRRLADLETDIDEAEADNDTYRAEQAHDERDALIAQLSAAVGLGGRDRRLGDESERARKAVTARIRDAIDRVDRAIPELGEHLRTTVQTGTWCTYSPEHPIRWRSGR